VGKGRKKNPLRALSKHLNHGWLHLCIEGTLPKFEVTPLQLVDHGTVASSDILLLCVVLSAVESLAAILCGQLVDHGTVLRQLPAVRYFCMEDTPATASHWVSARVCIYAKQLHVVLVYRRRFMIRFVKQCSIGISSSALQKLFKWGLCVCLLTRVSYVANGLCRDM